MPIDMVVSPVVLEGAHVRLEPLAKAHLPGLVEVGLDEELWRWIPTPVRTREEMAAYIETALDEQALGLASSAVSMYAAISSRVRTGVGINLQDRKSTRL